MSSVLITLGAIAVLSQCASSASSGLNDAFFNVPQQGFSNISNGGASGFSGIGSRGNLVDRQLRCENPSYVPCSNQPYCCPAGYTCFSGGCCRAGTVPCGSIYCYDPATEVCCQNGSCPKQDSCCTLECCRSIAYCGANGLCSACPPALVTRTRTEYSTSTTTRTRTVTEVSEPEEAPSFVCPPITVTNRENATLELDTGCALSYSPPSTAGGESAAVRARAPAPTNANKAELQARQGGCVPAYTNTITLTTTSLTTTTTTTTKTTTTEPENFSCPPMSVTNAVGDVLSLDESCALEYSPASPTATSSSTGPGSGSPTNRPSGSSRQRGTVPALVLILAVLFGSLSAAA